MPRARSLLKSHEVDGEWYRSTRYTIIYNNHPAIFPKGKSELRKYDPWATFRRNEGARLREPQPYLRLLELGKEVRENPENKLEVALDWCDENGLLGIIPVVANRILFVPTVEEMDDLPTAFIAKQLRYIRAGGLWRCETVESPYSHDREQILNEARDLDLAPPPRHMMGWGTEHFHDRSFISAFFPLDGGPLAKAPANPPVPLPGSREFFQVYGEPAHAIAFWASEFEYVVLQSTSSDSTRADRERLYGYLANLAGAAEPTFRLGKNGKLEEVRVSAGLLASFALMVLWDLQEGRRILSCKNCGTYFVSKDPRAGYCSVTCRNTAQSRRYRANKKTKISTRG